MLQDKPLVDLLFPDGKNNVSRETEIPSGSARELLNVDLTKTGELSRRKGYTSIHSGAGETIHSLYSTREYTVFIQGTTLYRLNPDYSTIVIRTGLDPDIPISYAEINGTVYYSNTVDTDMITPQGEHAKWGVDAPLAQPLTTVTTGSLDAGKYEIAMTYVSATGEESGSPMATVAALPSNGGGITVHNMPQSTAESINIYVTTAGGSVLYFQANIPMGTVSYDIRTLKQGMAIQTQFLERTPPGQIVRHYKGRMWVAVGNVMVFTEALRYGLFDPRFTYLQFPERITIMQPVDDGIYVVSDRTYFLTGDNPNDMTQHIVRVERGIPGTGTSVPPNKFDQEHKLIKDDSHDDVAFWYAEGGAMLGYPGGRIHPLTEDRLSMPEFSSGATLMREQDGIRQLVTSMTGRGEQNGFGAVDTAVAEVVRNGVLIT